MDLEILTRELFPLADVLRTLPLEDPARAKETLAARLPLTDPLVAAVRAAAEAGAREGWLVPKGREGVRYGRVARDVSGFSVDAVLLSTAGPRHRHPGGEIDLLLATSGNPRFDGHPEGWAVYPPGSDHVPEVTGGEMLILYFLPGGAIEWL